jgi:hypothetical protein
LETPRLFFPFLFFVFPGKTLPFSVFPILCIITLSEL